MDITWLNVAYFVLAVVVVCIVWVLAVSLDTCLLARARYYDQQATRLEARVIQARSQQQAEQDERVRDIHERERRGLPPPCPTKGRFG